MQRRTQLGVVGREVGGRDRRADRSEVARDLARERASIKRVEPFLDEGLQRAAQLGLAEALPRPGRRAADQEGLAKAGLGPELSELAARIGCLASSRRHAAFGVSNRIVEQARKPLAAPEPGGDIERLAPTG